MLNHDDSVVREWFSVMEEMGLTINDLERCIADPGIRACVLSTWRSAVLQASSDGICYDAASILGLGEASSDPLPDADLGEVVIRVGPFSLHDLRLCQTVRSKKLMASEQW